MNNASELRRCLYDLVAEIKRNHDCSITKSAAFMNAEHALKNCTPSTTRVVTETAVRVCPLQDRECGDRQAGWCVACPKRLGDKESRHRAAAPWLR